MKDSVFIITNEFSIKSLVSLSNVSKYIPSQYIAHKMINEKLIYEIPITIAAFDFISFIHLNPITEDMMIVPASQMRALLIKNINRIVPLVDIFTSLAKATNQLRRVVLLPDPCFPGVNQGIVEIEYQTHLAAVNALESITSQRVQIPNSSFNLEVFYAEPLVDNLKELIEKNTKLVTFENVNFNLTSPLIFKEHLEKFLLDNKEGHIKINKIRQYSDKMIVELDSLSQSLQMLFNHYYEFNGVFLPVKAAMKPCVNIGKYKEKILKLSSQALSDDDKMMLTMRLTKGKGSLHEVMKKKAEVAYNKIVQEEKAKELEKEKEKERELANTRHMMNKKREREREREREKDNKNDSSSKNRYDSENDRRNRNKKQSSPKLPQENNQNLSSILAALFSQNLPNLDINQLVQLLEMNKNQSQNIIKTNNEYSTLSNNNLNESTKGNNQMSQSPNKIPDNIPINSSLLNILFQQMATQQRSTVNDSNKPIANNTYSSSSSSQPLPVPQSVPTLPNQLPTFINNQTPQPMFPSGKGVDPSTMFYMGMPNPVMFPINQNSFPSNMNDFYLSSLPSLTGMNNSIKPDDTEMSKSLFDYLNQHYAKK